MKKHFMMGLGFVLVALAGCNGNGDTEGDGGGGGGGGNASQCDDLENHASPGSVVFRIKNQRTTPVYYDDSGVCSRAFTIGQGNEPPKSPELTGWTTCSWYMKNDSQGPLDCLTAAVSTLDPNSTIELTWDGRLLEHRDLPAECQGGLDSPPSCDQLVAVEPGTLTVHLKIGGGKDCSGVGCNTTDLEVKQQTFAFPAAGPVDIVID